MMIDELVGLEWEGDAAESGCEGRGVVDGKALVWNNILLVLVGEVLKVGKRDVFFVAHLGVGEAIAVRDTG